MPENRSPAYQEPREGSFHLEHAHQLFFINAVVTKTYRRAKRKETANGKRKGALKTLAIEGLSSREQSSVTGAERRIIVWYNDPGASAECWACMGCQDGVAAGAGSLRQ
jgi:hypothetical protein